MTCVRTGQYPSTVSLSLGFSVDRGSDLFGCFNFRFFHLTNKRSNTRPDATWEEAQDQSDKR
jgi:hypothetical protein